MTVVLKEKNVGRVIFASNALSSATRQLIAYDSTAGVELSAQDVFTALPALGAAWPDTSLSGYATLLLRERSIEVIDGAGSDADDAPVWLCTLQYETATNEGDIGFTSGVETNVSPELQDIWRIPPANSTPEVGFAYFPATSSIPLDTDIGGVSIDVNAEPLSRPIIQHEITVRNVVSGTPDYATFRSYAGTRNSLTWEGFPAGYVLYLGASTAEIRPGVYEVYHRLVYDRFAHMRQTPAINPNTGEPYYILTTLPSGKTYKKALTVMWRQVFTVLQDFSGIGMTI